MSFWWGYAVASMSRGGAAAGSGLGGLLLLGGFIALVMELLTPAPPKEITLDEYKVLIAAAGASCTGMSVLAHHAARPGGIRSNTLSQVQDILLDRIRHGERTACGLPPRPGIVRPAQPATPPPAHPGAQVHLEPLPAQAAP